MRLEAFIYLSKPCLKGETWYRVYYTGSDSARSMLEKQQSFWHWLEEGRAVMRLG